MPERSIARRLGPLAALAAVVLWALGGCSTASKAAPVQPVLALETFDTVWSTIDEQHFDPTHNGVDWIAVREEFRPQVAMVRSDEELRSLLQSMIDRLGQSHFGIIPREVASPIESVAPALANAAAETSQPAEPPTRAGGSPDPAAPSIAKQARSEADRPAGDLGVHFRLVDGRILMVAPRPGGPAARAGVESGWVVRAIDNQDPLERLPARDELADPDASHMLRYLAEAAAASCADVSAGESVLFVLEDHAGTRREIELIADPQLGHVVTFGNLPPLVTQVTAHWIAGSDLAAAGLPGNPLRAGYLSFNIWMTPLMGEIDAAVHRYRDADGLVLDLRGNPGGVGAMAMGVGGHFFSQPILLGSMISRDTRLEFRVNPRLVTADGTLVEPYAGPLAILVDPLTASTSEIFAAGLQEAGRARIFGQITAGAALPSVAMRLPNGDVLQYAMADFVTARGNRIEGEGVVPDEVVVLSRSLLRREADPTFLAALRWLASQHSQRPTSESRTQQPSPRVGTSPPSA